MEWTDQKQRFEPLNTDVVMPKDRKEQIRQRLHAEIELRQAETLKPKRRKRRPSVVAGGAVGAAVAAAACVVIGAQLINSKTADLNHSSAYAEHSSAMGAGTVDGPTSSAAASSTASVSGTESAAGTASGSREFSNDESSAGNILRLPEGVMPRTLDADSPLQMYGNYGWMMSGGTLLHTDNGASSWQSVKPPIEGTPYSQALAAVNGLVAFWAVGLVDSNSGHIKVYRTQNGGKTWQRTDIDENMPGSNFGQVPKSISFATPGEGWMLTQIPLIGMGGTMPGGLYRTTNGGETWSRITPSGFSSGLVPFPWVSFLPDGVGFTEAAPQAGADAGVTNGHYALYRSRDAGESWTRVAMPAGAGAAGTGAAGGPPTSRPSGLSGVKVDFSAPAWGSAAGYIASVSTDSSGHHHATLFQSTDIGKSWTVAKDFGSSSGQSSAPLVAASGGTVWVDWNGFLWQSTDAGKTWTSSTAKLGSVTELQLASPQEGYAVSANPLHGTNGFSYTVYRTTDGGKTWTKVSLQQGK